MSMLRVKTLRKGLLSFLIAGLLIACSQLAPSRQSVESPTVESSDPQSTLLVAAASSLQLALEEITPLYTQANSKQTINYNFASSGALQQQIEQGAPVDLFISAAKKQIEALKEKGLLLPETVNDLLTNQLVLIVPKQSSILLSDFQQLTQSEVKRIAIGEPRSVPAGQYATEVLKNLGVLEKVQSKFVLGNNVGSVLTAVETGDVDAGIVYITDAKTSDKVVVAAIAEAQLHSPIRYPLAILKSSKSPDAVKQYFEFLKSSTAKAVFKKYGFGIAKF
jgi:molybdate transport system substrate-binding protein